jgi:hypothetical protein
MRNFAEGEKPHSHSVDLTKHFEICQIRGIAKSQSADDLFDRKLKFAEGEKKTI